MGEGRTMTFDEFTARQAHEKEIANTRVGFLGGSDAKLVYHVSEVGVANLGNTDMQRLKVCFGYIEQRNWGGNEFTVQGHNFEDYVETQLPYIVSCSIEREKVMKGQQYKNFAVQAHADYATEAGDVFECKCVQKKTTESVLNSYYAQLQWYYMLGAQRVYLVHGTDEATISAIVPVERNDGYIECLRHGLQAIDEAADVICAATPTISILADDCSNEIQGLLADYAELDIQRKDIDNKMGKIKVRICQYMTDNGIRSIEGGAVSVQCVKGSVTKTLDAKKVLAAYPDIANGDFYEYKERKESTVLRVEKEKAKE